VGRDLCVCGELSIDGTPIAISGLLLVLLAVLAVRDLRGASRVELVELLWPEGSPAAGTAALDPLLSRLRRQVGPIGGRGLVRLDPSTRVDLTSALRALDDAAAAHDPASTLALATGAAHILGAPLAPGCGHPWVQAQRAAIAERHAEALTLAASAGLRISPPPDGALRAVRQLVALRPLDERPAGLEIDLLSAAGDDAAALGAYAATRERLRAQLAIAPGPELRARHRRLVGAAAGQLLEAPPPLPAPLVVAARTPLAGRAVLLADARDALCNARLVLVEGPPGIGKTHFAALLAAERHAAGATVLLARGTRVTAGPFAALAGAVRALELSDPGDHQLALSALGRDPAAHAATSARPATMAAALADSSPALTPLGESRGMATGPHGNSRGAAAGSPSADPDPVTARVRLFDAIGRLLCATSGGHGVLLVVDDVQDLDPSSLQVLTHLLVSSPPGMTILATARPDAAATDELRAALERSARREITLGPLDVAAVGELMRHARPKLAADAAGTLATQLHARTGGTPLLARAALAAPDRSGDLRSAVAAMAEWAGDDATTLLRVAALDDAGATLDILAAAAELDERRAGDALDRSRAAGLIASGTDVVHASVREALADGLGDAQRAAIHRRLARAYEQAGADAAPIAAHWGRGATAEARSEAARWEQRAAERALDTLAADDAARHARRALEHLGAAQPTPRAPEHRAAPQPTPRPPEHRAAPQPTPPTAGRVGPGDPARRAELALLLGRALNASSRLAEAREVLRDAQSQARLLDDGRLIAQIAAEAAGHRLGGGLVDPELVALVEEGLARTGARDAALRSRLAARLALLLLNGPRARRDALVDEAEARARGAGRPGPIAEALLARHTADVHLARPRHGQALLDEATGFARAAGRSDLVLHARMLRFSSLLEAGDVPAARREFGVWQDEAGVARVPYHRWASAICLPTLHLLDAENELAVEAVAAANALAAPLGDDPVVSAASGGQLISTQLATGRAADLVAPLDAVIAAGGTIPAWTAARAYCRAFGGDARGAIDDIAHVLDLGLDALVDPNRGAALSFLADAAVMAHAPAPLLHAIDSGLEPHAGTFVVQHFGGWVHGPADARRARLAAALGDESAARSHAHAAAACAGNDAPPAIAVDVLFAQVAAALAGADRAGALAQRNAAIDRARGSGLLGAVRGLEVLVG
jgi:DNA-binding SARP family transcriptional activator